MKKLGAVAVVLVVWASVGRGQMGRTTDWWSYAGDGQRTGWEKNEQKFTKDEVKDFRLLWKRKLDNRRKGVGALAPPLVLGNLIGSRGFKELAFVAGSSGNLWVMDADLDRMYWEKHFTGAGNKSSCREERASMPTLSAPVTFRFPTAPAAPPTAPHTTPPPAPAADPNAALMRRIFAPRPVFVVSSDGMLHRLNVDDGSDLRLPLAFLPRGGQVHSLNFRENVVYALTSKECGAGQNAVWALDVSRENARVASYVSGGPEFGGLGGVVLGTDGTVYAQSSDGLLALTAGELKVKDSFAFSGASATPVVFANKGKDLVAAAGKDGRLYLLDASSLGGSDHKTPLFQSAPVAAERIWGSLSSWEDTDGSRYVLAAVWGPLHADFKAPVTNGDAPHGSIVAFKLAEGQDGKPSLTPAWVSADMTSPAPPVIAQGLVFVLSNGEANSKKRGGGSTHATLYALDGVTGKQMYSTADQVTAPGSLTGLSIANGRVYFTTTDNILNVFGKYLETEPKN
jgi:hypothetical protein